MSTNDVPGARAANRDELAMGCWAEHEDGSLLFVESTEAGRVVYSLFDLARTPPIEYRDAMPENGFKKAFSWDERRSSTAINDDNFDDDDIDDGASKSVPMLKWTWHDKTPFPWDRVIKSGISDGPRFASAADVKSSAERIAESLRLKAERLDARRKAHLSGVIAAGRSTAAVIGDKFKRAFRELGR